MLENGETWGFYVNSKTNSVGAVFGNTAPNGLQISGSLTDFNFLSRAPIRGAFTGSFQPKNNLNIQITNGPTWPMGYVATYDQPASLASIAGTYSGTGVTYTSIQTAAITISPSGTVTMPAIGGCSASGSALPRPTGKNVFDVAVTFSGSSCAVGNGTMVRGIAIYSNGTFVAEALNGSKTDGFFYIATKK